jgi:hypothetical protein
MSIQEIATVYHEAKFGRRYADGIPWGKDLIAEPFVLRSVCDTQRRMVAEVNARQEASPIAKDMVRQAEDRMKTRRTKFLARVEDRNAGNNQGKRDDK